MFEDILESNFCLKNKCLKRYNDFKRFIKETPILRQRVCLLESENALFYRGINCDIWDKEYAY